jgi:cephalosporin hydroxylase
MGDPAAWSSPIEGILGDSMQEYWLRRVALHTNDSYMGVPLSKFPEDLRVFEHLIWQSKCNVVIELGAQYGGGALWFRDRLIALSRYQKVGPPTVISIDIEIGPAIEAARRADSDLDYIHFLEGDVRDELLPDQIAGLVPEGSRCLVVEDSAHEYDTTMAALVGFAGFVPPGGYFVVEDGCVDIEPMRLRSTWPRGVLPAVDEWLMMPEGAGFKVRRDLEMYGVTCHPRGFLQRQPQHEPGAANTL